MALAACAPSSPETTVPPTGTTSDNGAAAPTAAAASGRTAQISELKNAVEARQTAETAYQPAQEGEQILTGGAVKTGDEARVRIDTSEGSIIRVAANTEFTLRELSPTDDNPVTRLTLEAGKVWVWVTKALGAGTFEIETPTGTATVRGSLMSVEHDRGAGRTLITCLEGQCRLGDAAGNLTDLVEGQQTEIPGAGQGPLAARRITRAQIQDWLDNFPEVRAIVERLRTRLGAEPEPTLASGGGLTACDHPYFPIRTGASWAYNTTEGPTTWTVTSAEGDSANASASMLFTFSAGQITWSWTCTPAGLVSYDYNTLSTPELGQVVTTRIDSSSGVWLPPAELLVPGYSWSFSYEGTSETTVPGIPQTVNSTMQVSDTFTVVSADPVTVNGQTVDGLQVAGEQTVTIVISIPGIEAPPTTSTATSTYVYGRGIGMIESASTGPNSTSTSSLTAFNIP
jgi:hypothetical protein